MVSEIRKQKRKGSPPIPGRIAFKEEVNHLEWCSKFEIVAEIIIVSWQEFIITEFLPLDMSLKKC